MKKPKISLKKGHSRPEGEEGKTPSAGTEGGSNRYINGQRRSKYHELTDAEIASLRNDIREIGADESVFKFNQAIKLVILIKKD